MRRRIEAVVVNLVAAAVAVAFIYPFWWMIVASFRSQAAILSNPLRLLPEHFDLSGYSALARIGGTPLLDFVVNSALITGASTALGVAMTWCGAYALHRRPDLPLFALVRYGFLLKIMYPSMLLVIPIYFVAYQLRLLGTTLGIVLVMSALPLVFFIFIEFLRSLPGEIIDAARIDGASELQLLAWIVMPLAKPIMLTGTLIAFLLTWKQWLPVMVLSNGPETYTLPIALISLNTEFGVDFQAIMALAAITVVPIVILFVLTQRRVMDGFLAGSIKG
jgi:ABC-type glycerol-3-phosphate transport system permease component